MKLYTTIALASLALTAFGAPAFAQTSTADPACIIKNADGTETIDKTKCPDGKTPAAGATNNNSGGSTSTTGTTNSTDSSSTNNNSSTGTTNSTDNNSTSGTTTQGSNSNQSTTTTDTTASTTPATGSTDIFVPADKFQNAKVMSANDFIGKRVYAKTGEDIGEVNDLIVSDNGAIQAVILGVGGFLGIGEKDVAVSMQSIDMQQDGNNAKLVVDASKDQLNNAPKYNKSKRNYLD